MQFPAIAIAIAQMLPPVIAKQTEIWAKSDGLRPAGGDSPTETLRDRIS
ncbi:hypothetical protein [Nostoc sp. MG11]|nr:hypothetical protein [Nostoc sp. MG11]